MESEREATAEQVTILLVDDNALHLKSLIPLLGTLDAKISVARDGETALSIAKKVKPAVILLDVMMPSPDGFEVCRRLKEAPETAETAILFLTTLHEPVEKLRGFSLGAVDFITKPFHAEEVRARVQTQLNLHALKREVEAKNLRLARELSLAQALLYEARMRLEGPLLGKSPLVVKLQEDLKTCAANNTLTMLLGPSGCGYESLARTMHQESDRRHQAFFYINAATIVASDGAFLPTLVEGTDTLASNEKLALAHGGTVMIDRIQDLPMQYQHELCDYINRCNLLRQQKVPFAPDIRLITATHVQLHDLARQGKFVTKLLPLLMLQQVRIPGLGERREDIGVLAHNYLNQHATKLGKVALELTADTMARMEDYSWPGDIAELKSLMERYATIARGTQVMIPDDAFGGGTLLGSYRLLRLISKGGMGEVWEAKHQLLARPAAMKLIRQDTATHEHKRSLIIKRFHHEARATATLQSPHTVTLYDFGIDEQGTFYYVMELLKGFDLLQLCKRHGPLPPARLVFLLQGVCRSLEEAHGKGLIHRDLKPANVFVSRQGAEFDFAKILDFGVVKSTNELGAELVPAAHETNQVIGTPGYIAPEMYANKAEIDYKTDLYSLGCIAYFGLTAGEVFAKKNLMQIAYAHMQEKPAAPSTRTPHAVSPALDALILDCLAKDPAERPLDAAEIWQRLEDLPEAGEWSQAEAKAWWHTQNQE